MGDAAMAPINMLANAIADALQGMVKTLSTAWIQIDTPNLATDDGRASATVGFLQGQLAYLVGFCAVMALVLGGARLAWEGRHEPARDVLRGLLTLAVVSGCGLAVIGLLVTASDQLAEHIIDVSTDGNGFGKNLETLLALNTTLAPFMVIFLGVIALLVSLVQVVLIVFRAAALVMLAGFLPLAASFTSTPAGRQHFKRFTGWTIALVAYKPVAALCYAAAFRLLGSREFNADGVLSVLVGLALMTLAIVALPALLKFLVPAVQAISLGAGGGGQALMTAAVALPTGARVVHMAGAGGGYAAARGMSGPSGASSPGPSGGSGAPGAPGAGGSSGGRTVSARARRRLRGSREPSRAGQRRAADKRLAVARVASGGARRRRCGGTGQRRSGIAGQRRCGERREPAAERRVARDRPSNPRWTGRTSWKPAARLTAGTATSASRRARGSAGSGRSAPSACSVGWCS